MNEKEIGSYIRKLREEKNITQGELADILHVHRTAVNKWEKGKSIPLNDTLVLLSDYFNVSIDDLLIGEKANKSKKNNLLLSLLKSNRKSKMIIKLTSIIIFILLIIFLVYYFFTTYNSIHVYMLYGEGENYKVKDSLLIVSNEKVYLRIGNILNKDDEIIWAKDAKLYNKNKLIFAGDPSQLLVEKRNNIELFNTTKLKDEYPNMYLIVNDNDEEEKINLTIKRDFQNKGLLLHKKVDTIQKEIPNENYYKLNKDFVYDEEDNSYVLRKKGLEIYYFVGENSIKIYEVNNNQVINYSYQLNLGVLEINILNNGKTIEMKTINSNQTIAANEEMILKTFKTNYLDKYFSETRGVN